MCMYATYLVDQLQYIHMAQDLRSDRDQLEDLSGDQVTLVISVC